MCVRAWVCMYVSPTLNVCISVCVCARAFPAQCVHECEGVCARLLLSLVSLYA